MSIKVMDMIWKSDTHFEPSELLVLLALADWSDEDGYCYPGIPTLARKSRQSERNTRYIIRKLQKSGHLSVEEHRGRNNTNLYHINLQSLHVSENLQPSVRKPATQRAKPAKAIAPEPSVEPSVEPPDSGETKNVSLPPKVKQPKSPATKKAIALAGAALKEWREKTAEEQERGAAIADPRRAKQLFVREFAPLVAAVFGRVQAIGEDRGATGDIFGFRCDPAWLTERLTAYANGSGDEYRQPAKNGKKPVAYWVRDRIEREWAEYRQERDNAKQRAEERADYERRCAAALAGVSQAEQDSGGAHPDSVHLHGAGTGAVHHANDDQPGEAGIAVDAERGMCVRGDGVGVRGVWQPQVGAGPENPPSRSVREMFRDYKRTRHLSALDGEIQKPEGGPGG